MHDITAWNDGDVDVIDDIYADGAAYTDPMGAVHDRESLTEYIGMIRTAFPDFTVDVHQLLREGDTVACRYTFSGTMEDPYRGFEPTGESFELHGITWYHIQDEQVPTAWNATNSMAVAQQLGLLT